MSIYTGMDDAVRTPTEQAEIDKKQDTQAKDNTDKSIAHDLWLQHPITKSVVELLEASIAESLNKVVMKATDWNKNHDDIRSKLNNILALQYAVHIIKESK